MTAFWYVISGSSYAGWTVEQEDKEEYARRRAEAHAKSGKPAWVARCESIYRPASTREDAK